MTLCENCKCWKNQQKYKAVNNQTVAECHRHAPKPNAHWGSKEFTDDTLKVFVRWVLTFAQDGCEEGIAITGAKK